MLNSVKVKKNYRRERYHGLSDFERRRMIGMRESWIFIREIGIFGEQC